MITPEFRTFEEEINHLGNGAFSIIELVEVAGLEENQFKLIRKRLLNLGNDILRLKDKYKVVLDNATE